MNEPKVWDLDEINFLLATPRVVSATEAEQVQPEEPRRAAHNAFTRLLHRLEPDTTPLWREAEVLVDRTRGLLVIDDSTSVWLLFQRTLLHVATLLFVCATQRDLAITLERHDKLFVHRQFDKAHILG